MTKSSCTAPGIHPSIVRIILTGLQQSKTATGGNIVAKKYLISDSFPSLSYSADFKPYP